MDVYLLEKQSCQISSLSDLMKKNNKNKMGSDIRSVPDLKKHISKAS